mgnify:FL=1|jgi:hypothetical protein
MLGYGDILKMNKTLQKIINYITFYKEPKPTNWIWLHIQESTNRS